MAHEILFNEPALRSLKRQQLVQLCKRYGLRASGKRQENADETTFSTFHGLDGQSSDSSDSSDTESDMQDHQAGTSILQQPVTHAASIHQRHQLQTRDSTGSETWDLLDKSGELEGGLSSQAADGQSDTPRRWKSAVNGAARSDTMDLRKEATENAQGSLCKSSFTLAPQRRLPSYLTLSIDSTRQSARGKSLRSRVGSIRAAGSSLNLRLRNASSSSLGSLSLKRKASSVFPRSDCGESSTLGASGLGRSEREEMQSSQMNLLALKDVQGKGSARSAGIPKRHGHMLGSTVPSTIRLVTKNTEVPSAAHGPNQTSTPAKDINTTSRDDEVMAVEAKTTTHGLKPFCRYPIKNSPSTRRKSSEKHIEPSIASTSQTNLYGVTGTASFRAQEASTRSMEMSTSTTIYPGLPSGTEEDVELPIPGAFPTPSSSRRRQHQQQQQQLQPIPEPFIFGTASPTVGISNEQFGAAGDAVLEEMNRKLRERGIVPIGQEMDRGEVLRTKGRNRGLGENGLGPVGGETKGRGRFDDVHARQFAKWVHFALLLFMISADELADTCSTDANRMPSIGSGWKGRGIANTRATISAAGHDKKPTKQGITKTTTGGSGAVMTPGKRKAGEMMQDTSTDSPPGAVSRNAAWQRQIAEVEKEDSPRFKRMKTGSQAVSSGVPAASRIGFPTIAPVKEVAPKSRLGFLAASANSVKGTFSAIQDRLSNDREVVGRKNDGPIMSKTLQQQQRQPLGPPHKIVRSQSGFFGMSVAHSDGSLGSRHRSELDLHRISTKTTTNKFHSGGRSSVSDTTAQNVQRPSEAPATGLSLAYDLHVRKSKSSQALSAFASSTGNGKTPQSSNMRTASTGFAKTLRPAPPPPPLEVPDKGFPFHSAINGTSRLFQEDGHSVLKPLPPPPPRTITKSYSSNLLRPTASSLARMQATIPPPSRHGATPAANRTFIVPSYQDSPTFSRIHTAASAPALPTPRGIPTAAATPSKKFAHLVPKSPHRRAMERHTVAGRAAGGTGGATGGLKSKTFQARLAMGQKQREIEERRRARLEEGKMVF
ncbi:hypothetical protein QFC21_001319 [Naganishia friedmannii]|uniref:Uncharacterized protein n=1 Tax=Naganishia friedmannii TaxID=89922 RepID=A0ACC2W461_9TREE|nr:hypothetical protein QFC21_001319 [Naganishia friedmannii]